jgi:2-oxoglutarate ferredoxin oxidoreductase subunit beta
MRSYASALATLKRPDFPVPVGVIREVKKACYEDLLQEQVTKATEQNGPGDLRALLHSGDTWEVS